MNRKSFIKTTMVGALASAIFPISLLAEPINDVDDDGLVILPSHERKAFNSLKEELMEYASTLIFDEWKDEDTLETDMNEKVCKPHKKNFKSIYITLDKFPTPNFSEITGKLYVNTESRSDFIICDFFIFPSYESE